MFQFFTVTDVRVTRYCAIPRGTLTFVALPTSSTLTVLPLHYKRDCKNIQNGLISRKILQKGQCRPQQPTKHRCSHKLEASNEVFLTNFLLTFPCLQHNMKIGQQSFCLYRTERWWLLLANCVTLIGFPDKCHLQCSEAVGWAAGRASGL